MIVEAERPLIMVVEDEPYIRDVVRWLMEDEGYTVAVAGDGQEALALLSQVRPGVVLLDWMLPKGGGAAVLAGLRQLHRDPPPVLVISAIDQIAEKAQKSGAVGFIRKPFELDDVVLAVRRALDGPANAPTTTRYRHVA